jgi:hypothetical protein
MLKLAPRAEFRHLDTMRDHYVSARAALDVLAVDDGTAQRSIRSTSPSSSRNWPPTTRCSCRTSALR